MIEQLKFQQEYAGSCNVWTLRRQDGELISIGSTKSEAFDTANFWAKSIKGLK